MTSTQDFYNKMKKTEGLVMDDIIDETAIWPAQPVSGGVVR